MNVSQGTVIGRRKPYRMFTNRGPPPDQLAPPTKPLTFWNKWNSIALLVNGEIASIAEDDGISVFTIAVVTDGTFGVLLLASSYRLAIDGCGRA